MFIIPFDMASGIGYVSSTANAFPIGATGIAAKPMKTVFTVKYDTFLEGSDS